MGWNLFMISIALFGYSSAVLNKRSYPPQQNGYEYRSFEISSSPQTELFSTYTIPSDFNRKPEYFEHHHHNCHGYGCHPPPPTPFNQFRNPRHPPLPPPPQHQFNPHFHTHQRFNNNHMLMNQRNPFIPQNPFLPNFPQIPILSQMPKFPQVTNFPYGPAGVPQFPGNGNWNGNNNNNGIAGCIGFCDNNSQEETQQQPQPQPQLQPQPQPQPQPVRPTDDLINNNTENPIVNNENPLTKAPTKVDDLIQSIFTGLGPDGKPNPQPKSPTDDLITINTERSQLNNNGASTKAPSQSNGLIQSIFPGLGPDGKPKPQPEPQPQPQPPSAEIKGKENNLSRDELIQSIFNNNDNKKEPSKSETNTIGTSTIPPSTTNSNGLIYDIDVRSL